MNTDLDPAPAALDGDGAAYQPPEFDEGGLEKDMEIDEEKGDNVAMSSKFAKKVVNELYERYNTLRERKSAYKDLVVFLAYVSFNLSILYLQRDATNAYAVVSTIRNTALIPEATEITSTAYIYDWLKGTLENHWVDAKCGDDKCEAPFEFAFYGRFGCRPDCGTFEDEQQVTAIQIDMYYDFKHASSSTPATTLMQDVSWNLCPTEDSSFFDVYDVTDGSTDSDKSYIKGCYYAPDEAQTFSKLSGTDQVIITDVPDGEWQIYIKDDVFHKVRGAVRDRKMVVSEAADLKVHHLCKATAMFELRQEWEILKEALISMNLTGVGIIKEQVAEIHTAEMEALYIKNWTQADGYNETYYNMDRLELETIYNQSVTAMQMVVNSDCRELAANNMTIMLGEVNQTSGEVYCGHKDMCFNSSMGFTVDHFIWEKEFNVFANTTAGCTCNHTVDEFCAWAELALEDHEAKIKDTLLNMRSTMASESSKLYSKIMDYYFTTNRALKYEIENSVGKDVGTPTTVAPGLLVDFIISGYYADSPIEDAGRLTDFRLVNWEWPIFGVSGISDPTTNRTNYETLKADMEARVLEFETNLESESAQTYHYGMNSTEILEAIKANDKNSTLYTLVNWTDPVEYGQKSYMTCDMFNRAQRYLGTCADFSMIQEITDLENNGCLVCLKDYQKEQECNELCFCPDPCAVKGVRVCACEACGMDAEVMRDALSPPPGAARRSLLQSTDEYQRLLDEIKVLSDQQTALSGSVTAVSEEQKRQNEAAEAYHSDTTLKDTITNGFDDLQASYDVLKTQMNELLDKQNQALASQAEFEANQQRQLAMTQQLADQQAAINRAVEKQLGEIDKAFKAGKIDLAQQQEFKFRANLDEMKATKEAFLANLACQLPPASHEFELNRYTRNATNAARERLVGINNRIVAGMLLYSTRYKLGNCTNNRFSNIEQECITGTHNERSFGVDPVFKVGTELYDNELNYEASQMVQYYNCSCLDFPTYHEGAEPPETYCKELFNEKLVPYGFHPISLPGGYTKGFPVFFDINLSQDRAQQFYLYVEEGHYIAESETQDLKAHLVTYNAELLTFANIKITFDFMKSGKIEIQHSIQPVRVELYEDLGDRLRLGCEILLSIGSVVALALELLELFESQQKYGTFKAYFRSPWNYVDLLSISIQIVCMVFWWIYVLTNALTFDISSLPGGRYNVYFDPENSKARFLSLHGEFITIPGVDDEPPTTMCSPKITRGEGFRNLAKMLEEMEACGNALSQYMTLSGINIILMIARSLKLMDFQPRLGIVTKTLALAASDILHFLVVFGVVFMGYVMMGTLVFGYKIEQFSSLRKSLTTCFETLLGEIGWNASLQDLPELEYWAGFAYFWSYQILVFMILLNFLLAIIVDAYAEIKEEAHETVSVPAEVVPMLKEMWRTNTKNKYFYRKHIPEERIRKSLKVLAGRGDEESDSEESIEFEINPEKVLKVGDEEIDKDTLRRVLQHCIAYAEERAGVYDLNKDTQEETGGMLGCFGGKKKKEGTDMPPLFTAQDINGAVDMLMSQHGEIKSKDEEEEEEEEDADVKELMEKMQELVKGQDDLMRGQRKLEELEERLLKVIEMPPPDQNTE